MHHFFVAPDQVKDGCCFITGQDVNHIRNVLRMKAGDQVEVRDGISRNYRGELLTIGRDQVCVRILSEEEGSSELPARIYLFQGLPKGDKMDWIIQKAVELGVYQVIPMRTRRTVVKLEPKKEQARLRRWNAIAEGAAKQSGRVVVPKVREIIPFHEACAQAAGFGRSLIPYELAEGIEASRAALRDICPGMEVGVLIGPEGGFDIEEVEQAKAAGIRPVTLGRRILRTETAGMAALSILMFHLENDAR